MVVAIVVGGNGGDNCWQGGSCNNCKSYIVKCTICSEFVYEYCGGGGGGSGDGGCGGGW